LTFTYTPTPLATVNVTSDTINLSATTTNVSNNLNVGFSTIMNTATWNGKNIRVFNQAMSKSQTAGFGGLQTVVFNTVQASDGNGTIYNSNAWDFTPTITAQSINTPYALAQVNVGRSVDASGNWLIGGSITTSVAASAGITLQPMS
jgi:hypothetical protein